MVAGATRFDAREHDSEESIVWFSPPRLVTPVPRTSDARPRPLRLSLAPPRSALIHRLALVHARSLAPRAIESTCMFATRVSSFSVGFAIAAAGGLYVIRQDIQKHFQDLRREQTALSDRVSALERVK